MCEDCGGPNGWLLVLKDEWKSIKKELTKCDICGYYAFCTHCSSVDYINYGNNHSPRPEPKENEKLVDIRVTWCG